MSLGTGAFKSLYGGSDNSGLERRYPWQPHQLALPLQAETMEFSGTCSPETMAL